MYITNCKKNSKIKFALEDKVHLVEKLSITDIVGDIRDKNNPNYGEIALAREFRLSMFYDAFLLKKYFNFLNNF